ncbi:hypothetical protein [Roseivirga misakiensis]|uniref:Uncharacterized protein n=1 Tax=Roseivirga misakiensis TaxID=1563681 RepID=A0A1E5T5U5_9BACT|nr:hypothetical protein [Roseivirga misakiensis]OEK06718.1 hypothetical protein BFP71_03385 [Roseivirga misakiensis]
MKPLDPQLRGFQPQRIGSDHLSDPELHKVTNKSQLAEYYGWSLNKLRQELKEIQTELNFNLLKKRTFTTGQIMRIADQLGVPNDFYNRNSH